MAKASVPGYYSKSFPNSIACADCAQEDIGSHPTWSHKNAENYDAVTSAENGLHCTTCGTEVHGTEAGDQADNVAAAKAVAGTIQTPPNRAGDTSRRMVAAGRLGKWAQGSWTDETSGDKNREVRISGSIEYDRDFFHEGEDPTIGGTYSEPVVKADYLDYRDKTTGESRGKTVMSDPWTDDAVAAKKAKQPGM